MTKEEAKKRLEQIEQEVQDLKKFIDSEDNERWEPEVGGRYWMVNNGGDLEESIWVGGSVDMGRYSVGNVFETEGEAIDHRLRLESMANRWRPEEDHTYYSYRPDGSIYCDFFIRGNVLNEALYWMGNMHKTREDAKAWGKKYGKAFSLDNS